NRSIRIHRDHTCRHDYLAQSHLELFSTGLTTRRRRGLSRLMEFRGPGNTDGACARLCRCEGQEAAPSRRDGKRWLGRRLQNWQRVPEMMLLGQRRAWSISKCEVVA